MTNLHEVLHPDSEILETSVIEEVEEKTDAELGDVLDEKNRETSINFVIEEVKRLNPGVQIESDFDRGFIFSSVDAERLNLPEGFYFNQKNGITNKHRTKSGVYISLIVYPISYYDPDYL